MECRIIKWYCEEERRAVSERVGASGDGGARRPARAARVPAPARAHPRARAARARAAAHARRAGNRSRSPYTLTLLLSSRVRSPAQTERLHHLQIIIAEFGCLK